MIDGIRQISGFTLFSFVIFLPLRADSMLDGGRDVSVLLFSTRTLRSVKVTPSMQLHGLHLR